MPLDIEADVGRGDDRLSPRLPAQGESSKFWSEEDLGPPSPAPKSVPHTNQELPVCTGTFDISFESAKIFARSLLPF
jgi:hypothetical protein